MSHPALKLGLKLLLNGRIYDTQGQLKPKVHAMIGGRRALYWL